MLVYIIIFKVRSKCYAISGRPCSITKFKP